MRIRTIILGLAGSLLVYLALNFVLLKRPVTLGYIETTYAAKEARARVLEQAGTPKMLIIAGSNGYYSHRCETIAQVTGRACVNFAVSYIAGLDAILARAAAHLAPGDVALMPLEYGFYSSTREELNNSTDSNRFTALYQPRALRNMSVERGLPVVFSLSVRDIFSSAGEMLLSRLGMTRDTDQYKMNEFGDIVGHTAANGRRYQAALAQLAGNRPNRKLASGQYFPSQDLVGGFVRAQSARGVIVIGSLPTTFNDRPFDENFTTWFRYFYTEAGGHAVLLPNRSLYPRSAFYNTAYHLNEEAQIEHSRLLGAELCASGYLGDCHMRTP